MRRVAFLGPSGTYTEQAAMLHAPQAELAPHSTIYLTLTAVEEGGAAEAVVPIENSLVGSVADSLDFLTHSDALQISGELVMPIEACLIGRPAARLEGITRIRSKSEAFGQCAAFLRSRLPHAEQEAYPSTSAAVESLARADDAVAAIGPKRAADLHAMKTLAENIQTKKNNVTRFIIVTKRNDAAIPGANKTSLAFELPEDRPGGLAAALMPFSQRGINLTKIESRPTGKNLGSYRFFLDCEGARENEPARAAVDELRDIARTLKVLGSYPAA